MKNKPIKNMTYKEFKSYNKRMRCDTVADVLNKRVSNRIIKKIDSLTIKAFGFITLKRKTEQAREEAWQRFLRGGE